MHQKDRTNLVETARFLIDHASLIDYAETRPMTLITGKVTLADLKKKFAAGQRITMDCSYAVTYLDWLCGLKDPNGLHYDGQGYTGTLLSNLKHYYDVSHGHEGSFLVFSSAEKPTGIHVCMVMEPNGNNPMLFSHGSQIGPLYISLEDEKAAHEGEYITMLDVSHL